MASISSAVLNIMFLGSSMTRSRSHTNCSTPSHSGEFTLRAAALKIIRLISPLSSNYIPLPITVLPHEGEQSRRELTFWCQTSELYGECSPLRFGHSAPGRPYTVNRKLPERGAGREVEIKAQLLSFR